MAKDGASAPDGMLPSYPSLTFPNHLSLVTGLYPEHHGIVANSFYDPSRDATYVYTKPATNADGSWYSGTPLWVLAEQQGMRSACLFWPGSEAEIQGKRPSYYLHYDDHLDDEKRVDQVIAWLNLPPEQRPHFITLYYPNVDHMGHAYGPDSDEVRAAVHHVDDMIGDLQTKLAALHLPVDLIVIADHGMVTLKGDPIDLNEFADLAGIHTEGAQLYPTTEADAARSTPSSSPTPIRASTSTAAPISPPTCTSTPTRARAIPSSSPTAPTPSRPSPTAATTRWAATASTPPPCPR